MGWDVAQNSGKFARLSAVLRPRVKSALFLGLRRASFAIQIGKGSKC